MSETVLQSSITCPVCGHRQPETMPTDACRYFYDCENYAAVLKPRAGDYCVFCPYGDGPRPADPGGGPEDGDKRHAAAAKAACKTRGRYVKRARASAGR